MREECEPSKETVIVNIEKLLGTELPWSDLLWEGTPKEEGKKEKGWQSGWFLLMVNLLAICE